MNDQSHDAGAGSSQKRIDANRRNGRLGHGPVTPSGKAKSSQNAITHGFFAKAVVLETESLGDFEALSEQIFTEFAPRNAVEEMLVKEIVDLRWRLGRLGGVEAYVFKRQSVSGGGHQQPAGFAFVSDPMKVDPFGKLCRYEAMLTRRFQQVLTTLRQVRKSGWAGPTQENESDPVRQGPAGTETLTDGVGPNGTLPAAG